MTDKRTKGDFLFRRSKENCQFSKWTLFLSIRQRRREWRQWLFLVGGGGRRREVEKFFQSFVFPKRLHLSPKRAPSRSWLWTHVEIFKRAVTTYKVWQKFHKFLQGLENETDFYVESIKTPLVFVSLGNTKELRNKILLWCTSSQKRSVSILLPLV